MNSEQKPAVTLGVDAGGKDADEATRSHYMSLRRLLAAQCVGPYSSVYREFALVLRIDGSVQSWGKRGVDNVRLQRKSHYATADIFVPADVWKDKTPTIFRAFLAEQVVESVHAIVVRITVAKESIDGDRLVEDVQRVAREFTA